MRLSGAGNWTLAFLSTHYNNAVAIGNDGATLLRFVVGVLQGGPCSSQLFVLAINPLLIDMVRSIGFLGRSITRACAYGIGAVVFRLEYLDEYNRV